MHIVGYSVIAVACLTASIAQAGRPNSPSCKVPPEALASGAYEVAVDLQNETLWASAVQDAFEKLKNERPEVFPGVYFNVDEIDFRNASMEADHEVMVCDISSTCGGNQLAGVVPTIFADVSGAMKVGSDDEDIGRIGQHIARAAVMLVSDGVEGKQILLPLDHLNSDPGPYE